MKFGAIDQPWHPAVAFALDYAMIRVAGAAPTDTDWFKQWNWPATGNMLSNDELSDCCEAADVVLVEGWRAALGLAPLPADELTAIAELRYAAVGGWNGGRPGNDPGTVTQADCFAWASGPIVVGERAWQARWCSVQVPDIFSAIRRGPLLLTLALPAIDAQDPTIWSDDPVGVPVFWHRVVAGAAHKGLLTCRTWGRDVAVSPLRVVGADLLLSVDMPAELRTAGIDWRVVA
jgi:hypothetical protein